MMQPNIQNLNFNLIKIFGVVFFLGIFNQLFAQDFNFNYAKSFGGIGQETQTDMSVDSAGNIVLLGRFSGIADFDPGPQENIKEAIGSSDIYLAKYNSLGSLIWVHTFGNNGTEMVGGCDFDSYGNIVFSGTFSLPLDVNPSENVYTLTNAGTLNPQGYGGAPADQGFIVKLSPEGSFIWAYTAPAYYGSFFYKLRVNSNDEIVFYGIQYGWNWNFTSYEYISFIRKISTTGQLIWNYTHRGSIYDIDINSANNVLLTGLYYSSGFPQQNIYNSGTDYFLANGSGQFVFTIDSNGALMQGSAFEQTSGFGSGINTAINNIGQFYVVFTAYGPIDVNLNSIESYLIGNTQEYYYGIAKYSSNGEFIWAKTIDYNTVQSNVGFTDISISNSDNIFLCGYFNGQVDFNPSPTGTSTSTVSTTNTANVVLLKLSSNGEYISKRVAGNNFQQIIPSIGAVNNNEDYFTAGFFYNNTEFNPNGEFISDNGLVTTNDILFGDIFISKFSTCVPSNSSASIVPVSQNLCINTSAQPLNLIYNGSDAPNYQWYYSTGPSNTDGTIIPGANSSSYTPPTDAPMNYYYYCKASINSTGCSLNSPSAHVTVFDAPNITSQALDIQTICIGGVPLPLSISTSNPAGVDTFQWYTNSSNSNFGGVPIAGATSNSYTPTNTSNVGSTYYYCVVCGVTATNAFRINVVADPVISTQPINSQTICLGGTPNGLSTSVSGGTGGFAFQWFNAATNLPVLGANSSTYTPSNFPSPNNYEYYLQVSQSGSGCNTVYSTNSTVTVIADPVVSASPVSQSICTNGSISPLEIASTGGTGTISFQWYRTTNNSNAGGTAISGANSASYLPPANLASNYYYYATVNLSGSGCSANSPTSLVAVNPAPSFSAQPIASQTVCVDGTPSTLNVNYSNGAGIPNYQWWINNVNSTNNAILISGASSASFIPNSSAVGTTYYFCTVTFSASNCGFITSNISSVTVVSDPVIAWHPIGSIICVGGEANPLSVDVSGGVGTYTYQWYNSATGNSIAGATSALFYPGTFNTPSENSYYVQINQSGAGCDALTSSTALVSVVEDPTLSSNSPSYQIICEQSNIDSLEILVLGGTQLSYQWFIAPNSSSVGNPIANANSLVFPPTINSVSNNFYYCHVSSLGNGCTPSINSIPFQIEIVDQPQITNSAYSVEACQNNTMPSLEIAGNYDTNPVIHFLQSNTVDTYDGSELSSTNYSPSSSDLGNYSYYFTYNVDYPGCLADTSDFYNVTISEVPQLNLGSTEPIIGCVGAEIDLSSFTIPNLNNDYILVWNLDNNSSDTTYASNTYSTQPIEASGSHNMQVQMLSTLQYCSVTDELNLSIDIVPDPSIAEEQNFVQELCPFDKEIDAPTVLLDFDNSIGPPTYTWNQVQEEVLTPLANSNQSSYLPQLPMNGVFNSQCVVQFEYPGCDVLTSSLSALTFDENNLDCFPEIVIPEAISPNNDGMNDFWTIPGIEQFNGYEINIFNSFGQSIYFVKNTPPSWDGTWNGQTLPNGDYFYSVKLIELNRTIFGTVSVQK
jgi:gliding motility-associated-like protein